MDLGSMRERIDAVDAQIVELFRERMTIAAEVADYKVKNKLPVLQPGREREVLTRVSTLAGAEYSGYARVLFGTLMDLSRACQMRKTGSGNAFINEINGAVRNTAELFPGEAFVACPGAEGSFSEQACDRFFSHAGTVYFKNFRGVFQAVDRGLCKYGVLPIENSSYGSVNEVYALMREHKFYIVRSARLHIRHSLLALPGARLGDIREIISHEQAIGQCSAFLALHPEIEITKCDNTALAAKYVKESADTGVAAICSLECGSLYGLESLSDDIQDNGNNYTRFILIGRELEIYPGSNRISVMLTVPHRPGSLYRLISRFAAIGLNLTKLESKPIPGSDFDFMFYLDMEASVLNRDVAALLAELSGEGGGFTFLGCYGEV